MLIGSYIGGSEIYSKLITSYIFYGENNLTSLNSEYQGK